MLPSERLHISWTRKSFWATFELKTRFIVQLCAAIMMINILDLLFVSLKRDGYVTDR